MNRLNHLNNLYDLQYELQDKIEDLLTKASESEENQRAAVDKAVSDLAAVTQMIEEVETRLNNLPLATTAVSAQNTNGETATTDVAGTDNTDNAPVVPETVATEDPVAPSTNIGFSANLVNQLANQLFQMLATDLSSTTSTTATTTAADNPPEINSDNDSSDSDSYSGSDSDNEPVNVNINIGGDAGGNGVPQMFVQFNGHNFDNMPHVVNTFMNNYLQLPPGGMVLVDSSDEDDDLEFDLEEFSPDEPIPVPKEQMDQIPIKTYESYKALLDKQKNTETVIINVDACCICREKFESEDLIRYLPCCHVYHIACIDPWLEQKPTCPVCQVDLRDIIILNDKDKSKDNLDNVEQNCLK